MPWKNGLGFTHQIDIQPPGSSFPIGDAFSWRLSSATVSRSSAFSLFPNCDRILVVWTGAGLLLNNTVKLERLKPYTFSGEEPINCDIIGDTDVVDFGIIFRRDLVTATMSVRSFKVKPTGDQGLLSHEHVHHVDLVGPGFSYLTSIHGCFTVGESEIELVNPGDTVAIHVEEATIVKIVSSEEIMFFHVHVTPRN